VFVAPSLIVPCHLTRSANGRLAEEYAGLLAQLWSDRYRAVAPVAFKTAMGSFRAKFYDHEQQDTHEFLTELLGKAL
jgi:uncharacterized UBP type Zn finger protein